MRAPRMAFYVGLYFLGLLIGLAANLALDVQLHRPGLRQFVGLILFGVLLWGVLSVTHTAFADVILPLLWLGIGLLAGLGSRDLSVGPT